MAPPVVRHEAPLSTILEGDIVHRESSLMIRYGGEASLGPLIGDLRGNHHIQRENMALKII
jgi:hypothetical protein